MTFFRPSPTQTLRLGVTGLAAFLVACSGGTGSEEAADLVLTNGTVITVDDNVPDGAAIAVADGRILAVGSAAEIDEFVGDDTEVIDLDGRVAIPGLIEGHAHFMGVGNAQLQLRLATASTWQEIVDMVGAAAADAEPGEVILGRGWHQEKWTEVPGELVEGAPLHHGLSAVSPDNPVILTHASGHASYANARAMEIAGIDSSTPNPPGGEIIRDADGNPTGMFRETASRLLNAAMEGAPDPDPRRLVQLAQEEVLSKGITSFHDAGAGLQTVDLYKALADEGALDVRLWVMLSASIDGLGDHLADYRTVGYGDNHVTVAGIKAYMDGALGSHGAWLLAPYADFPTSSGLNVTPVEDIEETARIAAEHDYQLCVHAIGDRANREVLDLFAAQFEQEPDRSDWRWRIEHAQHLNVDDIPRFSELGVIASMQGVHATSDAPYVFQRLGQERAEEGAYVWQKLLDAGAVVMNGTDAPVEDVNPLASFYSSVSRRVADGSVFFPDQRMSRMEGLRSYTIAAAYGAKEEHLKGSLTPGKLADITVLSQNILTVEEDQLGDTQVEMTIVGGDVKYRRN